MINDIENNEHFSKWKKTFMVPLQKVLKYVHPDLLANDDALEYVESLILRLLVMLCAYPHPHTVQDVEERVLKIFPTPMDKWTIGDAQYHLDKGKKKSNLIFPIDKVHQMLRDFLQTKIDYQVSFYVVAVLEYISHDILKLVGKYVLNAKVYEVTQQDIRIAMCADKILMDIFHEDNENEDPLLCQLDLEEPTALMYDDLVKDLIMEEKCYIRELQMIIKVFKDKLQQIPVMQTPYWKKKLDGIFSNILEIKEFSVSLLGSLEDTLEGTKEDELPPIGTCFEELAEGAEFDVYDKYGNDILTCDCIDTLLTAVNLPEVNNALTTAGQGFKEAVKYCLPRLLLVPIIHVFKYFKYIERLLSVTDNEEMKESLEQVMGLLFPLQSQLDRGIQASPYNTYIRRKLGEISIKQGRMNRRATLQKLNEIQKSIEGWEGKDIAQCCTEYILEGGLKFGPVGKRLSDRHVFLFDGLIVLCKFKMGDYKFKEKFMMRMIEIVDREDTEDLRYSFEIRPRDQPPVCISAKSVEEKNNWMSSLILINTRSMLERTLDSILLNDEKHHPLRLPDPAIYPFSEPDSEENIVIEERENSGTPLIRGAKLFKLVERLTYHMYADPMFVRTFLTTYRSFCTPLDLLNLLIKRFDIPEPGSENLDESSLPDHELFAHRESLKRFRKEYSQPVQFRVLNVLRHWVDYHFYDFEAKNLLEKLTTFLDTVKGKSMKKWVESITKIIQRKCSEEPREITFSHNKSPPSPKIHIPMDDKDWEISLPMSVGGASDEPDFARPLLMLHPVEIARQLTLVDFDYYRAVKPSELVGTPWTKEDKERRSPNLLKMIHHTNTINHWLQRCVVETDNFDERVSILCRIIEVLVILFDLNNFCGVFQLSAVLESAAVHRLELTKTEVKSRLPPYQRKVYDDIIELGKNHNKKYVERLRSINPPCVPFFGMYLTNIIHIEEGNPDFLPKLSEGLINFNKRRKVAEITGEIQQYQNQPYCLETDDRIMNFLKNLRPFKDYNEHEIANYLYEKSKVIEPKNFKKPLVKDRRWPSISLKSPAIKPRSISKVPNPLPAMFASGHKIAEGIEGDETPHHLTPPTPSTPGTPNMHVSDKSSEKTNDNTIFMNVVIGSGAPTHYGRPESKYITDANMLNYICQEPPSVPQTPSLVYNAPHTPTSSGFHQFISSLPSTAPPPLPPRKRRDTEEASPRIKQVGDASEIPPQLRQAPDAPELPPRDMSPPPIPPRTTNLPRMHSAHASSFPHFHTFMGAPSHLQYRLDPPPQRRKSTSADLPQSSSKNSVSSTPVSEAPVECPPAPPPRNFPRQTGTFS